MTEEIFTPLGADMLADPRPVYARLRESDPVHWHDQLQAWLLTRHADCLRVVKDLDSFGSDLRKVGRDIAWQRLSLQTLDPPDHTALRRPILAALKTVDVRLWTKQVQELAAELVASTAGRPVDVITELAEPLSLQAMCLLYGVPRPADGTAFCESSRKLVLSMDGGLAPERVANGLAARDALNDLVEGWMHRDEVEGMVAHLRAAAGDVPVQHLVNTVRALFHAGYASTSSLVGNAVLTLAGHGGLSGDRLAAADTAMVEEVLRLDGPVQGSSRACLTEVKLGGRRIPQGNLVIALYGAANHDPTVFADPAVADFGRDPNPHLAFGRGVHACLGAHLAIRIVLALFHELGRQPEPLTIESTTRRPSATLRGLSHLILSRADS